MPKEDVSDALYTTNPSAVSCDTAMNLMKRGLRSVVMSKLAFDTFRKFQDPAPVVNPEEHGGASKPDPLDESLLSMLEKLERGEVHFTTAFCKDPAVVKLAKEHKLTPHGAWKFRQTNANAQETAPRSDIVFVRDKNAGKTNDDDFNAERTPVCLIEVGKVKGKGDNVRLDNMWFEKLGQGTNYLGMMNDGSVTGVKRKSEAISDSQASHVDSQATQSEPSQHFGKLQHSYPILFFVIAFGDAPEGDQSQECMNIGCFISEKKKNKKERKTSRTEAFRIALLYRSRVIGSNAIAKALRRMLEQIMSFGRQVAKKDTKDQDWLYLGPHCALVSDGHKKEVYRAYDNRPWPIARSSSLYNSKLVVDPRLVYGATAVNANKSYRLFDFHGGVEVIAIPFVGGSHIPTSMDHLRAIAEFLKRLHDADYVHGDIRLLNMVFTAEPSESILIDFDFGGQVGSDLVYPLGYQGYLPDGSRYGKEGKSIEKWHDVIALLEAFDKVLSGAKPGYWELLKDDESETLTIDDAISALDRLEKEDGLKVKVGKQSLRELLEENSKLEGRLSNQHTRLGDAKTPAKK